ncbi:hypothetical protein BpHYR1_046313 [Brachionus plicatilis]|uniref:Uncharacterized protein n=1 Tax=Brachionus plicatilis TaxID=10195 RepID=A0A3M7SFZ4_BRAPC|nr:hypothetical protein BpHYR1_046313 [Brachionus plicatilis]
MAKYNICLTNEQSSLDFTKKLIFTRLASFSPANIFIAQAESLHELGLLVKNTYESPTRLKLNKICISLSALKIHPFFNSFVNGSNSFKVWELSPLFGVEYKSFGKEISFTFDDFVPYTTLRSVKMKSRTVTFVSIDYKLNLIKSFNSKENFIFETLMQLIII